MTIESIIKLVVVIGIGILAIIWAIKAGDDDDFWNLP